MTKIAFIGLGIMGSPMAVHLQNAGHQVTGYNKSPGTGRRRSSRPAGATRRRSPMPSTAPTSSPSWCPDSADVQAVLTGDGRRVRERGARHARHRLLQHPARRDRAARPK